MSIPFTSILGDCCPAQGKERFSKVQPLYNGFHPSKDIAYVDNEQGGSVTVNALDTKAGTLTPIQTVSTLSKDLKGTNACAEIKIHPTGKFLYVSNRGHDSIACFKVDAEDGKLTTLGQEPTEKTPRSFDLDPSGKFLRAAGEAPGTLLPAGPGALLRAVGFFERSG